MPSPPKIKIDEIVRARRLEDPLFGTRLALPRYEQNIRTQQRNAPPEGGWRAHSTGRVIQWVQRARPLYSIYPY